MSKKTSKSMLKTLTICLLSSFVVGCAAEAKLVGLPVLNSNFTEPKVTAYKNFGFEDDSLPKNMQNIMGVDPTEFDVNLFVGQNQDCKIIYTTSIDGVKDQETKSASFKAYLTPENVLIKVICAGEESNIDYKIIAKANGQSYYYVGNLSYMEESSSI